MKDAAIFFSLIWLSVSGYCQNDDIVTKFVLDFKTGDTLYSFYVFEEKADRLLDRLYEVNNKKPKENPIHNFRNQKIEGLEKVTIQVMEGTYFEKEEVSDDGKTCKTSGIRTFRNKKAKNSCPDKLPENVREVKQVYFRDNNLINLGYDSDVLDTQDKKDIAVAYLESLL